MIDSGSGITALQDSHRQRREEILERHKRELEVLDVCKRGSKRQRVIEGSQERKREQKESKNASENVRGRNEDAKGRQRRESTDLFLGTLQRRVSRIPAAATRREETNSSEIQTSEGGVHASHLRRPVHLHQCPQGHAWEHVSYYSQQIPDRYEEGH